MSGPGRPIEHRVEYLGWTKALRARRLSERLPHGRCVQHYRPWLPVAAAHCMIGSHGSSSVATAPLPPPVNLPKTTISIEPTFPALVQRNLCQLLSDRLGQPKAVAALGIDPIVFSKPPQLQELHAYVRLPPPIMASRPDREVHPRRHLVEPVIIYNWVVLSIVPLQPNPLTRCPTTEVPNRRI